MNRFILMNVCVVLVMIMPLSSWAQEDYAVVKDGTISFYYDNDKGSRQGTVYDVSDELAYGMPSWKDSNLKTAVFDESFSKFKPNSTYGMFSGCSGLVEIKGMSNLNTSEVTNMNQMFAQCSSLEELDLSGFDTGKVTSMEWMFYGCKSLTELSLSGFNTENVESMSQMFANCMNLKVIDISGFNTSSVTNMYKMFSNCAYLEKVYVGDGWTTMSVSNGANMFENCFNLVGGNGTKCDGLGLTTPVDQTYARIDTNSTPGYFTYKAPPVLEAYVALDGGELTFYYDGNKTSRSGSIYDIETEYAGDGNFPAWQGRNIVKVTFDNSFSKYLPTSTARWFHSCSDLTEVVGIDNLNTSDVTSMMSMFYGCSSLSSLDLSGFSTSKVTCIDFMFYGCSSMRTLDLSSFETDNVTTMVAMFYGCTNLEQVDLSSFDTRNVENMEYLFFNCSKLVTVYAGKRWSTEKLTMETGDYMFYGCNSLVGGEGTKCDGITLISYVYAKVDEYVNPGYFSYKSSDISGIAGTKMDYDHSGNYYSLQGKFVAKPTKGLYIKNGKKVIVR